MGQLIRAAVVATFNDHPDWIPAADMRQIKRIASSIGKRAIGAIKTELGSKPGTGAKR